MIKDRRRHVFAGLVSPFCALPLLDMPHFQALESWPRLYERIDALFVIRDSGRFEGLDVLLTTGLGRAKLLLALGVDAVLDPDLIFGHYVPGLRLLLFLGLDIGELKLGNRDPLGL